MVSSVDEAVGNIIETLEATGGTMRTLIWQSATWLDMCNLKRRPTIEFAAYFDLITFFTQNSLTGQTVLHVFSQITFIQFKIEIPNKLMNRADGKHCGHLHIGQWCRGKVDNIKTHFKSFLLSLLLSFSEANLPFQGLRGSIYEVRL